VSSSVVGGLHFHCVLRLDGVCEDGELEAPAARYGHSCWLTPRSRSARAGAPPLRRSRGPTARLRPSQGRVIRWGAQIEIRELDTLGFTKDAALCVGHIAKYVTKLDRWSAGSSSGKQFAEPPG
jgi:hypothetical protein